MSLGEYVDIKLYGEAAEILEGWKQNRDDWDRLKVLADFYEENNRPDQAFCCRWMAVYKKRPTARFAYATGRNVPNKFRWAWYCGKPNSNTTTNGHLPPVVFRGINSSTHKYYPSEEAAMFDLAQALAKLNEVLSLDERKNNDVSKATSGKWVQAVPT